MTTMTDVTFDLLVVEQLHDVVPCDDDEGCDRTAHWVLRCANDECHVADLLCNEHRASFEEWAKAFPYICCTGCEAETHHPLPWRAL